jgi:hypothetical protein
VANSSHPWYSYSYRCYRCFGSDWKDAFAMRKLVQRYLKSACNGR